MRAEKLGSETLLAQIVRMVAQAQRSRAPIQRLADVVSAYRFDRTGEGYVRVVYSALYNLLVRVLFGVRIRDINFAFKLCHRRVLDRMTLESEGSFIDAELVVRTVRAGGKVVQFGVDYFPRTRGVSTLSSPAVIVKILREMFSLRRELRALQPDA